MANPYPGNYPVQHGQMNFSNFNGATDSDNLHNAPPPSSNIQPNQQLSGPPLHGHSQNVNPYNGPQMSQDLLKKTNSPSAFRPPTNVQQNPSMMNNLQHYANGHPSPSFNQPNVPGGQMPPTFRDSPHSRNSMTPPHSGTPPPRNNIPSSTFNNFNSYTSMPPALAQNNVPPTNLHHTPPPPNSLNQPSMAATTVPQMNPPYTMSNNNSMVPPATSHGIPSPLRQPSVPPPATSFSNTAPSSFAQGSVVAPPISQPPHHTPKGFTAPPPLPGQPYVPPNQQHAPPPNATWNKNSGQTNLQSTPNPQNSLSQYPPLQQPGGFQPPAPPINNVIPSANQVPGHTQPPGMSPATGYPQMPGQPPFGQPTQPGSMPGLSHAMGQMSMNDPNKPVDLMKERRLIPEFKQKEKPLQFESRRGEFVPPKKENASVNVFRSTLKAIPATQSLLSKVKLPFGLTIHPFRDLSSLPVISAGTIVRCKRCRTYINPFVTFMNQRQWRCNLCFVPNDVPDEFMHHPVTKSYGEPHTRPECTNATLEFIAPQEYMVRPPQPAVYLFLLDVSHSAASTGYLQIFSETLLEHLDHLPGDARTKIGFITYTNTIQFYRLAEGLSQPQVMVVSDIDDIFLPTPDSLLVNLRERKELVQDLLQQFSELHTNGLSGGDDTQSALGAALQIAHKLIAPSGGRVTVFQHTLPIVGPGSLQPREESSNKKSLNPANDFYKKIALDCSGSQVAVDFFFLNSRYVDIATLSCASTFSAGDIHYYPSLHTVHNPPEADRLARDLDRYFTRKIGFESVMRIRCTKGIGVHTFHGNFYVRSTDLLALANINPDAGYALNLSIDESLEHLSEVCFQAALLYTSSKGERRIRVHTMCFPIVKSEMEVYNNVDSKAVVALLSKMAVDRSITASVGDARDALLNAVIDPLKVYNNLVQGASLSSSNALLAPPSLTTMPLYISCLLKHTAFQVGVSQRLDDRVFAMINLKTQPVMYAMQSIHPDLYRVDDLTDEGGIQYDDHTVPQPALLPLSAEYTSQDGAFLLDTGWKFWLLIGRRCNQGFIKDVLGSPQFSNIQDGMHGLPEMDNPRSEIFNNFLDYLQDQRPHHASLQVVRDDSQEKYAFYYHLKQDRTESTMSLQEFLMHVQQKVKS